MGAVITQYLNIHTLCIGRLLIGFAAGQLNLVCAKSIDETMPAKAKGQFGTGTNAYLAIGNMLILFLGSILPQDAESMKIDERWRIMLAIPLFISVL